jgi:hypothetical protein
MTAHAKKMKQEDSAQFNGLTKAHLQYWSKLYCRGGVQALVDRRADNSGNGLVPDDLISAINQFILRLLGQKIELNAPIFRPFILQFIKKYENGKYASLLEERPGQIRFKCSVTWIKTKLRRMNKRYQKVTNDAGKLPDT